MSTEKQALRPFSEEFDVRGWCHWPHAIDESTALLLSRQFEMHRQVQLATAPQRFDALGHAGDGQVSASFSQYGFLAFEALLQWLQCSVEHITSRKLWPCNSYARIYHTGAELTRHVDSERCEYSVTVALDYDRDPWPIWLQDLTGETLSLMLQRGDACVYRGTDIPHWRMPFTGLRQTQVFLHYVAVDGPHADCKYDGRSMLGMPL
jgi:hypothetical protein